MKQPDPATTPPSGHYHENVVTPVGVLVIECSDTGLRAIHRFDNAVEAKRYAKAAALREASAITADASQFVRALCSGTAPHLPVALDLQGGTALQRRVWDAIAAIPYGKTISYTELAKQVGKPAAVRAVASACGKNPVPLVIPCHRVLAKDGSLGGFAWGLDAKRLLLTLERSAPNKKAA